MSACSPANGEDDGFALVFVLMVITMLMAAVGTTLFITSPNITASKRSQDTSGALLAAQAGIDDAIAYLTNVPSCRSETRICPQALGASSAALAGTKYQRPTLGTTQTFSWTTAPTVTSDGYVRVTSIGRAGGLKRSLVADLSLQPSILAYGYYTDYESQAPSFFVSYFPARSIRETNSTTWAQASSSSAPQTVTWNGATSGASLGYPDTVCGQHWYYDSASSPGRSTAGTSWRESGKANGNTVSHSSSCDLVFTTGMTEDGPTYTRDALLISNGGGSGPNFKQPVYTLWGYPGHNNPAVPAQPWRQATGSETLAASTYKPVVASSDITLPASIGTDGVSENSCVYYGPTRVKLNGDGTATVTSPETITKNSASDAACYPTGSVANGITGYVLNYQTAGSGTIYVKNLNKPSAGWPQSSLTSTSTPSASNEIFYFPASGGATTPDQPNTSLAPDGCGSATYSAATSAACAWSTVNSATDNSVYSGYSWTSYTAAKCSAAAATNRELFECEYGHYAATATPAVNQTGGGYKTLRTALQTDLAKGSCQTGTGNDQLNCIAGLLNTDLATANTTSHRYVVTAGLVGTATTGTQNVGSTPSSPVAGDPLFATTPGVPAQETVTRTPISLAVNRQVSTNNGSSWSNDTNQFVLTVTQSSWAVTQPASGGTSYFPNPNDITPYATGATSAGVATGSTGTAQPGDLYVDGVNSGSLSLIAENNVEITGNITKQAADTSAANPLSITAGNDVRNYHPVSCVDQAAADINATTSGWCPNDITGLNTASLTNSDGTFNAAHPAAQYTNINGTGDRTVDAAVFTLTGSLRTDNYDRAVWVGNLNVYGGIYQSHRGANGVQYSNSTTPARSGTSLQYHYVDLQRAHLPYAPSATYSTNPRVWNVVSISAGTS